MISVIVPVYQVEKYLTQCVMSLIHQTIPEQYEILLVDDGSKDHSGAMCDELQAQFPEKVRVFHKPNGGLSSARNYGLQFARGDWISYVDSDDYVSPTYLEELYNLAQKFDADMSALSYEKTAEGKEIIQYPKKWPDFCLESKEAFYELYITKHVGWGAWNKLYRKEVIEKHPFPDGYFEEMASVYKFVKECKRVAFGDDKSAYHYIHREGSITTEKLSSKHYRIFDVCNEVAQHVDQYYPEWKHVKVLMYENAVLQLINRTRLDRTQFKEIFLRYRPMFRKNMLSLLLRKDISFERKYYAVVLSTSPRLYRIQRKLMSLVRSESL